MKALQNVVSSRVAYYAAGAIADGRCNQYLARAGGGLRARCAVYHRANCRQVAVGVAKLPKISVSAINPDPYADLKLLLA